jgi:hypothetical protein
LPYQSIFVLLEQELAICKEAGTSVKEQKSGFRISIKPLDDKEIVLFFKTDHTFARKCLHMPDGDKKSCDYLACYLKDKNSRKESICFLELKGKHFDHAVEQIINTSKYIRAFLKHQLERDQYPFIVQGASICMHSSAPDIRNQKKGRGQLTEIFGADQYVHIKHGLGNTSYDLGNFMRKLYDLPVR